MTIQQKMMKKYHKAMARRYGGGTGSPLLWTALGAGAVYLLRKRGHHKIEVD